MKLHHLLKDRDAVRILKMLYDEEVLKKGSYTMKISSARKKLGLLLPPKNSVINLSDCGLVTTDNVDGNLIMSITNKGKEFIESFDQLAEVFKGRKPEQKSIRVNYSLMQQEKRVLVMAYRISTESGMEFVPLKILVQELYPYDQRGKTSVVSRYISKLEEIKLMERKKDGRVVLVSVTEQGFKTIKEQYLKGLMV